MTDPTPIHNDARALVERTTKAQGLPLTVEDSSVLERLAAMIKGADRG